MTCIDTIICYRTNFFYGPHIVYGANGNVTDTPGKDAYDVFHKYTIEWYCIYMIQLKDMILTL
jgi:hypothetical protein